MNAYRPLADSRGFLTLDPEAQGKSSGHLVFPWSRDDSAWGTLPTPIGLIANGEGPTVLLVGGNHGDELEGPLAIRQVFDELAHDRVAGRIFFLPSINHAAVASGRRTSPIDGANMNRCFLGKSEGSMTEQIAHFLEAFFVEAADAVLDIHSGGRSMKFAPFAATHVLGSPEQQLRANEAVSLFGAPYGLVLEELDDKGMLDTAVERRGKLFLTTELGGGGGTTCTLVQMAVRGVRNFLAFAGSLPGQHPVRHGRTRMLVNTSDGYISSPDSGLVRYEAELGDALEEGDLVATLFNLDDLSSAPVRIVSPCNGLFLGQFHGGMVQRGDFLGLIARDPPSASN